MNHIKKFVRFSEWYEYLKKSDPTIVYNNYFLTPKKFIASIRS